MNADILESYLGEVTVPTLLMVDQDKVRKTSGKTRANPRHQGEAESHACGLGACRV